MYRKSLITLSLFVACNSMAEDVNDSIETIEVKGSYLEGYHAHSASGASRLELDIIDIPQSVSVITHSQMQDFRLTNIDSVLDTATGVNVERIETDRTYYTARGFDITNFQIDGVGLPLSSGNNHSDEDTAIYDRVEVIRGANGLMTGVGNPSATVNFIRKRPGTENALNVLGSIGSWNATRLEIDGTSQITDDTALRGVIAFDDSDSHLDRYNKQKSVAYFFLNHQLNANTSLSLSHAYTDSNASGNNWGANPLYYTDGSATDFDVSTSTSADWAYWNIEKHNTTFEVSHVLANNWQVRGTYSHKSTDEDSELFYVYGTPDKETGLGLFGYASEYDNDDSHDLVDLYLAGEFDWLNQSHQFVIGVNHSAMSGEENSLYDYTTGHGFPAMPPLETWDGDTPLPTFADGQTGSDVAREQQALYFTTRFAFGENLHVTAGGRLNDWQITGQSYGTVQDASDQEFIPYLGAVYNLTDSTVGYASYTETFISQTKLDINDKVLAPITGESQEVGLKSALFNGNLLAAVTYFETRQENVATLDPATANLSPEQQRYKGTTGIKTSGYEIDVAGELLPNLQSSIGLTVFDIEGDELVKNYTPSTLIKLAAIYQVPQIDGLSVGLNVRWQDAISRVQGQVGEGFANEGATITTTQDSYAITDLVVKYQFNEQLHVTLNANNVSDEKYLTSLYWAQGYYGSPANVALTLNWSL